MNKLNNIIKTTGKYPDIAYHGITFEQWNRPTSIMLRPGKNNHKNKMVKIYESSIGVAEKVLFMIDRFYRNIDNKGKDYFVSTTGILKTLNKYGFNYCRRTVQNAINKLAKYNLISIVPYPATEDELAINPKNHHLKRRKLIANLELINKYISVFDEDDRILKELPDRHFLKKIIKKRPYSLVGSENEVINIKYEDYQINIKRRKLYNSPKDMLTHWSFIVSSRYYNQGLTRQFIPTNLDNVQEVVDKAEISKVSSKGIIDINIFTAYKDNIDEMTREQREVLIGWKAPPEFQKALSEIGYVVSSKGFITGLTGVIKTQGFDTL